MARLLYQLGLQPYLKDLVVHPRRFNLRRWSDGQIVGGMDTGSFEGRFGYPYLQVHRGDLHRALLARATTLGVSFCVKSKIVDYDLDCPSLTLASGESRVFDLIVAADGSSCKSPRLPWCF